MSAVDVMTVTAEHTTLDLLLWRVLRREVPGLVEATLDLNPGLAALGPILPVGTRVLFKRPDAAEIAAAQEVVSLYE